MTRLLLSLVTLALLAIPGRAQIRPPGGGGTSVVTTNGILEAQARSIAKAETTGHRQYRMVVLADSQSDTLGIPGYFTWPNQFSRLGYASNKWSIVNAARSGWLATNEWTNDLGGPYRTLASNEVGLVVISLGINDLLNSRSAFHTLQVHSNLWSRWSGAGWNVAVFSLIGTNGLTAPGFTELTNFNNGLRAAYTSGEFDYFFDQATNGIALSDGLHPSNSGAATQAVLFAEIIAPLTSAGRLQAGPTFAGTTRFRSVRTNDWAAEIEQGNLLLSGSSDIYFGGTWGNSVALKHDNTGGADDLVVMTYGINRFRFDSNGRMWGDGRGLSNVVDLTVTNKSWVPWSDAPTNLPNAYTHTLTTGRAVSTEDWLYEGGFALVDGAATKLRINWPFHGKNWNPGQAASRPGIAFWGSSGTNDWPFPIDLHGPQTRSMAVEEWLPKASDAPTAFSNATFTAFRVFGTNGWPVSNGSGLTFLEYGRLGWQIVSGGYDSAATNAYFRTTQDTTNWSSWITLAGGTGGGGVTSVSLVETNGPSAASIVGSTLHLAVRTNAPGGGGSARLMTLPVGTSSFNPGDGDTRYFGGVDSVAPTSTEFSGSRVYITHSGTIKAASLQFNNSGGANGSSEAWPIYIRVNGTTDYLIENFDVTASDSRVDNSSLSIAVSAGDYVMIKMVNPTWATNPTSVRFGGYLVLEVP